MSNKLYFSTYFVGNRDFKTLKHFDRVVNQHRVRILWKNLEKIAWCVDLKPMDQNLSTYLQSKNNKTFIKIKKNWSITFANCTQFSNEIYELVVWNDKLPKKTLFFDI